MKILYISPEVVPLAKTGGLADVAGALPKALRNIGHDIRVIMPFYKMTNVPGPKREVMTIKVNGETVEIFETKLPDTEVTVYLVAHDRFFGSRDCLYQVKGVDYPDNLERFALFCQVILPFCQALPWKPDILHGNDWQSALAIAYLKTLFKADPFFARTASVYSI